MAAMSISQPLIGHYGEKILLPETEQIGYASADCHNPRASTEPLHRATSNKRCDGTGRSSNDAAEEEDKSTHEQHRLSSENVRDSSPGKEQTCPCHIVGCSNPGI